MATKVDHDWQTTKDTVLERSSFMFNNPLMSDITFTCGQSKRKNFYAHKYVLATSSPVFYAMFYGVLAQKDSVIHFADADEESFEEFLRFLYTDDCNLTPATAVNIMALSKKYIIPSLSNKCVNILLNNITAENVFLLLKTSMLFLETELEQKCWNVIDTNADHAVASEAIAYISQRTVKALLKRETMKVKEVKLFKAILKWIEFQCEENNLELTRENKREVLGDAFYEIRFLSMSEAEFTHEVSSTGLLTAEESLTVYQRFNGLSTSHFPWKRTNRGISLLRYPRCSPTEVRSPECAWSYCGCPDRLCFTTNKDVMFYGVQLFGDQNGGKYHVTLEIGGTTVRGIFSSELVRRERYSWYGFDVMVSTPIKIEKGRLVEMNASIKGPPSYYFERGQQLNLSSDGVMVTFSKSTKAANGTNETRGQFYEIILGKVVDQ